MFEARGDLWTYEPADARVITTNAIVKANGEAVMGRGVALQAARLWPEIPRDLAYVINHDGSRVVWLRTDPNVVAFPTKVHWRDPSSPGLIVVSAQQLVELTDLHGWKYVVLPRPGCGAGGLNWESDVRPLIEGILDDRFTVLEEK